MGSLLPGRWGAGSRGWLLVPHYRPLQIWPNLNLVSAVAAGRGGDATALVFEYMAATQAETGRVVPGGIGELPVLLQRECRDLPAVYHPPGALLIAYHGQQPTGCVGLAPCSDERTAEVKQLYVRPGWRGNGSLAL